MPVTNSFRTKFVEDPEECYLPESASGFDTFESAADVDAKERPESQRLLQKATKSKRQVLKKWLPYFWER